MSHSTKFEDISGYVMPTFYTVVTHPLTYARTLMQLGYEPIPPYLGHSVLSSIGIGSKVFKYPSIFTYCKHVKEKVGIVGLFTRGLPSRIIYWHMSSMVSDYITSKLSDKRDISDGRILNTETDFKEFLFEVRDLTIARSMAVIISYPFQGFFPSFFCGFSLLLLVLMVRQMAEIMNDGTSEPKYLFSLLLNILDDEGFLSLYNGLSAKLVGEIATVWLTAGFVYVFDKYVLKDRVAPDIKDHSSTLGGFLCSSLTYRFSVISTVMSISGSQIIGAVPFKSIFECYSFLSDERAFNRGASLFLRYAD